MLFGVVIVVTTTPSSSTRAGYRLLVPVLLLLGRTGIAAFAAVFVLGGIVKKGESIAATKTEKWRNKKRGSQ